MLKAAVNLAKLRLRAWLPAYKLSVSSNTCEPSWPKTRPPPPPPAGNRANVSPGSSKISSREGGNIIASSRFNSPNWRPIKPNISQIANLFAILFLDLRRLNLCKWPSFRHLPPAALLVYLLSSPGGLIELELELEWEAHLE